MKKILGLLLIGGLLLGGIATAGKAAIQVEKPQAPLRTAIYTPEELLAQANALRAEKGIPPLKLDARLNQSAQMKADDMKAGGYYDHKNPITNKQGYEYIIQIMPNACAYVSENLDDDAIPHTGYTPFDKQNGWPGSKPHLEAEIDPRYEITGFAYTEFNGFGYYVQHFCDLK